MKKIIEFFYNIVPDEISYFDNKCSFYYNGNQYILKKIVNRHFNSENLNIVSKSAIFHKVILNRYGNNVTMFQNEQYVLMEKRNYENRSITLEDLIHVSKMNTNFNFKDNNEKINWGNLWKHKVDSFEKFMKNKSFINYCEYFDYYIGMAENAISYFSLFSYAEVKIGYTYNRIWNNFSLDDLYDPTNVIIGPVVEGIAEFFKTKFLKNENLNILPLLDNFNYNDFGFLISRILFPTYFFDLFKFGEDGMDRLNDFMKNNITSCVSFERKLFYLCVEIKKRQPKLPIIRWLESSRL